MSFNIATQPCISVVWDNGTRSEVGMQEAVLKAHRIIAVEEMMPIVEFGQHRLLTTLVLDIFKPQAQSDWAELWNAEHFDEKQIADYFAENADSFDLFDEHKPFLQSAGMEGEKAKPLAGLLPSMPSGTATNHFHHGDENDFGVSPKMAMRLLTTIAPWMTAGGAGLSPSINGAPPLYVLPLGANLFQTLLFNMLVLRELIPYAQGEETPAWRDVEPVAAARAEGASLLASLSWRPRRVQLVAGKAGTCALTGESVPVLVRSMKFAPGFGAGFPWVDPNCAYRIGDERVILRPREEREIWRDTGPLALLREKSWKSKNGKIAFERPAVMTQLSELINEQILDFTQEIRLAVYGVRTDLKMKTFEWVREILHLPFALVGGQRAGIEAQKALEDAESVAFALRRAIRVAYPREGKGNDDAFATLVANAEKLFWRELRHAYDDFLHELAAQPKDEERDALRQKWRDALNQTGWVAIRFALEDMDGDAIALERQTMAYKNFRETILAIVNPEKAEERAERAKAKKAKNTATKSTSSEQLSLI